MKHIKQQLEANGGHRTEAVANLTAMVKDRVLHAPGLVSLTASERLHQVRLRPGAEKHIRAMATVAEKDARFRSAQIDPSTMRAELASLDDLLELRSGVEAALQKIDDTILFRGGQAYNDALDVYAMVQSHARREPELHASIAAFERFLATGSHAAAVDAAPVTAATTAVNGAKTTG